MTCSEHRPIPESPTPEKPFPEEPEPANTEAVNPRDVRLAAMDLLARREHLQRELQTKLRKRFADHPLIDEVLRQLAEESLQSDERFCESYVNQRSSRGYGPERIRMELRQKGAQENLALRALENLDADWLELARSARCKKFGEDIPVDFKDKSRQLRFLQYRGFGGDTLTRIFQVDVD
jgi:regulatory protein